jgi:hypothetical protein
MNMKYELASSKAPSTEMTSNYNTSVRNRKSMQFAQTPNMLSQTVSGSMALIQSDFSPNRRQNTRISQEFIKTP